ncbi:MAG: tRNA (adenosine(37)-N6)-threonylcarbamoyltransferase complex ATPase subunit type 1 TsaE [Flavobacteriales bacterium]|nr:tRNA (adenosine(37)-N6)-threonylcarbamoyltransferase complex ATPase subunit type 1 TsaE [Flavobacteriales bacterium]
MISVVSKELLKLLDNRIFVLHGDVGVGKTTLVKYFCMHLEVRDSVSSPTFPVINEYINIMNEKIFHFDFYRLKKTEECKQLGLDYYFQSGAYCFIEWPQIVQSILPDNHHTLKLHQDGDKRVLSVLK